MRFLKLFGLWLYQHLETVIYYLLLVLFFYFGWEFGYILGMKDMVVYFDGMN